MLDGKEGSIDVTSGCTAVAGRDLFRRGKRRFAGRRLRLWQVSRVQTIYLPISVKSTMPHMTCSCLLML